MPAKYKTLKKSAQFKQIMELGTKFVSSSFVLYGLDKALMGKRKKVKLEAESAEGMHEQLFELVNCPTSDESLKDHILVGFTASRRVGNSVKRSLAKRRMRSAIHQVAKNLETQGFKIDLQGFVLIAKIQILNCNFAQMTKDLEFGLKRLIGKRAQ